MNNITSKKKLLSVFLAMTILVASIFSYNLLASAENSKVEDLRNQISEYEKKIDAAQEKIDALSGDITKVKEYIEELDKQVAMYQEQIDVYQAQIDEYESEIENHEAENKKLQKQVDDLNKKIDEYNEQIDELEIEIQGKYDELKELIRTNFINGESSAIEVLLCSDDFSEYLTKVQFVSSLADYEQGIIDSINSDIETIDNTITKIDAEKTNIQKIQKQIDDKIKEIENLKKGIEENKAKVVANQDIIEEKVAENSNYLSKLNNQSAEYEEMIDEYEAAIAQFDKEIEQLLRSSGSSGSGTLSNSSGLICPLQYSNVYVSSGFYRNSGGYHGALDLCTYGGTYGKNISAAEAGKVITASYHWSYGNYVVIDHGNGLSTLYAHASSLAVSAGQSVSKGQTVAYVGSTGNSTGPHLHFEVRVNGSRVNPSNYISV